MNGVIFALIGTLFTFSVTTLGAFNVFFVKRRPSDDIQKVFLGFAGGVMVAGFYMVASCSGNKCGE